ncbi:hypothetical protein D3C84_441050 [compost metagenome]|jgi:hypothetical protein
MTQQNLVNTLREITTSHASRSDMARLRDVFDDVENALRSGVSRKAVLEALHADGFKMTPKSFENALFRIRKQRATQHLKPATELSTMTAATTSVLNAPDKASSAAPISQTAEQAPQTVTPSAVQTKSVFAHLAVDHEARKKEDPNYYNPTPDLEKIYGGKKS